MYIHIYVYTHISMYIYVCVCIHIYTLMCIHVYRRTVPIRLYIPVFTEILHPRHPATQKPQISRYLEVQTQVENLSDLKLYREIVLRLGEI